MKLFDDFIKAKEDHIIERYCEDDEPCLDCIEPTDAHNTREVKKMYVDDIAHHVDDIVAPHVDDIVHHVEDIVHHVDDIMHHKHHEAHNEDNDEQKKNA